MTKKIAILGTTPSRMEGPIDEPDWQIWTIGPGGKDSHRWDRLYEMHTTWPEDFKDYLNDLSRVKKPQQVRSVVPLKERMLDWAFSHDKDEKWLKENIKGNWSSNVPINREAYFDKYRRMWFSSSISYCIAEAIEEGATDIGCWGIDLESGEEYISQHAGCAYFLDLARHMGINVHLPNGCGLMRDLNPYPDRYETHLALTFEKKKKWLQHLISQAEQNHSEIQLELYRTEGALLTLRQIPGQEENAANMEQQLIQHTKNLHAVAANLNHLKGEQSATEYYQRMYVWGMIDPNEQRA